VNDVIEENDLGAAAPSSLPREADEGPRFVWNSESGSACWLNDRPPLFGIRAFATPSWFRPPAG